MVTQHLSYITAAVIMLSGLEGEELARKCLELGAAELMKKPFDEDKFATIAARIFAVVEEQEQC